MALIDDLVPLVWGSMFDPDKLSGMVIVDSKEGDEIVQFKDAHGESIVAAVGLDEYGYWVANDILENALSLNALNDVVEFLKDSVNSGVLRHLA